VLPPLAGAALEAAKKSWFERRQASGPAAPAAAARAGVAQALGRLKMAPPTPFNTPITNQRAFAAVGLPLGEVKAIGKAHGASINDMVMWICSTALREYLRDARELPAKSLVAGVPISLRAEGDTSSNNQVSGTVIDLATQVADPLQRLKAIQVATRAMKDQMSSFGSLLPKDFPSLGSPWLLSGLASLYGRSRLAGLLRVANVVISNVPGPQVPLYLAGARMAGIYPLSIVTHGIALNITVQSYMGQLCVGLIACRRALPDVKDLADLMGRAMEAARALPVPAAEPVAAAAAVSDTPAAPKAPKAPKPRQRTARVAAAALPASGPAAARKRPRRAVATTA
jgi:WS/DGAT/MGAT family acyltransferase